MASNLEIKSLVDEITSLGSSVSKNGTNESEEQRRQLRVAAKKLGFALERPFETLERIAFWVSSISSMDFRVLERTDWWNLCSLCNVQLFGAG